MMGFAEQPRDTPLLPDANQRQEQQPNEPLYCRVEGYELSAGTDLSTYAQDVDPFICREYELALERSAPQSQKNAVWNHITSWGNFTEALSPDTPARLRRAAIGGLLLLATDSTTGRVVGLSTALLEHADEALRVGDNYVGVSAHEAGGYGLGGALILLRDRELVRKGITSYDAHVWPGSHRMYDRIGATYDEEDESSRLQVAPGSRTRLRVALGQRQLEHQCAEQLCVGYSTDVVHSPVTLSMSRRHIGTRAPTADVIV